MVRCFCGWYSNIKHLFQYIALQCKTHEHIHVVRDHVKAKDGSFKGDSNKTSIWEEKLSVWLHIYKLELLKKSSILGDVPIAVCSLYIFPPYVPLQRPQKRSTSSVCFHHLKRCTSQLCVDDLVLQLAGIPNLGFFEPQTTLFDRRVPENPGKKKNMETSKEDEHLKNGVFFFWCVFVLKVGSYWKKNRETRIHRIHP